MINVSKVHIAWGKELQHRFDSSVKEWFGKKKKGTPNFPQDLLADSASLNQ